MCYSSELELSKLAQERQRMCYSSELELNKLVQEHSCCSYSGLVQELRSHSSGRHHSCHGIRDGHGVELQKRQQSWQPKP